MDFQAAIDQQLNKPGLRRSTQASALEEKPKGLHPLLKIAPTLGHLGDAYSTQRLLALDGLTSVDGKRTIRSGEANPAMGPYVDDPAVWYGIKGTAGAATSLLADHLARKGKKKEAIALAVAQTLLGAIPAAINIRNEIKARKSLNEVP